MPHFSSLVNGVIQIVLTMQSYFVRPAGMADMLRTSSSGFTVRLAQSREEPARLQIVIIDALMNFEQLGAQSNSFYISFPIFPLVSRIPQWLLVMHTLTIITCNTPLIARLSYAICFLSLAAWPGVRCVYVRRRLNWFHRREEQDFLDVCMMT